MRHQPGELARELQQALGRRLRGPVVKVAQLLATVPGAAPSDYVAELLKLQSQAPPMGWTFVKRRIARELGADWPRKFAEFERTAAAAASLGQVHRAVGLDGSLARDCEASLRLKASLWFRFRPILYQMPGMAMKSPAGLAAGGGQEGTGEAADPGQRAVAGARRVAARDPRDLARRADHDRRGRPHPGLQSGRRADVRLRCGRVIGPHVDCLMPSPTARSTTVIWNASCAPASSDHRHRPRGVGPMQRRHDLPAGACGRRGPGGRGGACSPGS